MRVLNFLKRSRFRKVYILPSTFHAGCRASEEFFRSLPRHVTVFCRERESYRILRGWTPDGSEIRVDHDMALCLERGDWKKQGILEMPSDGLRRVLSS